MKQELAYWIGLAHLPKMRILRKNEIIIRFFEEEKSIIDFFHLEESEWISIYGLNKNEIRLIEEAKKELANYAFLIEDLLEQGYEILPVTSKDYSPVLKKNLGRTYAPPVIYVKGNKEIMKENSVAIVGSRNATDISLEFTDNIAKKVSKEYKVIVSGFAKGIDKQALDSAIKYKGQSIIVLPQGIMTFGSGFKKYYKQIIDGDVLVLSTFYPKAPWSVQLAMARNPVIYGLAGEIYVAESSEKGGTWSGVIDGLRKNREIYVRKPINTEKNANNILISKGAKPVDEFGNIIEYEYIQNDMNTNIVSEQIADLAEQKIIDFLKKGVFISKKIIDNLKLDWTSRQLTNYLKNHDSIITVKGKPLKFTHKETTIQKQTEIFFG